MRSIETIVTSAKWRVLSLASVVVMAFALQGCAVAAIGAVGAAGGVIGYQTHKQGYKVDNPLQKDEQKDTSTRSTD